MSTIAFEMKKSQHEIYDRSDTEGKKKINKLKHGTTEAIQNETQKNLSYQIKIKNKKLDITMCFLQRTHFKYKGIVVKGWEKDTTS